MIYCFWCCINTRVLQNFAIGKTGSSIRGMFVLFFTTVCESKMVSKWEVIKYIFLVLYLLLGLLRWFSGKESDCQCGRARKHGFDPWVRKISWSGKWQPAPAFLPGKFHGQRSLADYNPWSHKELDTTEHDWARAHTHACTHTPLLLGSADGEAKKMITGKAKWEVQALLFLCSLRGLVVLCSYPGSLCSMILCLGFCMHFLPPSVCTDLG